MKQVEFKIDDDNKTVTPILPDIDVEQVKVETPTDDGVVKIYVPQATILDINADKTTISDPIEETGILTRITADEKAQAFSAAQATMRENAESAIKPH